jgi:hypothetical protein
MIWHNNLSLKKKIMDEIKKPTWDKQSPGWLSAGSFNPNKPIPPYDYICTGMTAHAKHKSDEVVIKITKVVNKCDAEGIIVNIIPKTKSKPKTYLSIGDRVFIARSDMEPLVQFKTP